METKSHICTFRRERHDILAIIRPAARIATRVHIVITTLFTEITNVRATMSLTNAGPRGTGTP
jgi:hypothetical protein